MNHAGMHIAHHLVVDIAASASAFVAEAVGYNSNNPKSNIITTSSDFIKKGIKTDLSTLNVHCCIHTKTYEK